MRGVDQYGNVAAMVAAELGKGSGAPELKDGAIRFLVDTGSQSTCANEIGSLDITQKTPPTGEFGLPFTLLDGGNGRHIADHGGALSVVTVEGGIPITFA